MHGGWLDFELPLVEVEKRIADLRSVGGPDAARNEQELRDLERKAERLRKQIFAKLTPWQRVQMARHPRRPYTLDYAKLLLTDFEELHGDRAFADDASIVAGLGRFEGRPIALIGQQKGRNTKENLERNFGMPHPEGYRKALRVMRLAEKFGNPILCLVDTPGAYPGLGAEERGQSEAIARSIREMSALTVPVVVMVTGEGGSGGALAIAVGNRVFILEYAFYSVISPEGCASILWKTREKAAEAAAALKFTPSHLLQMGVVDAVLPEPPGGAHRDPEAMAATMAETLRASLAELGALRPRDLAHQRQERYLNMGVYRQET